MSPWKSCKNRKKGELVKIGVVIGRIGGEDGVALETEKWITVLERMGHQVCVLSGALEGDVANVELLPGLAFEDAQNELAQAQAFFGEPIAEDELVGRLEKEADELALGIDAWIAKQGIELLISENANALPFHVTMGMAIERVLKQSGLPAISHDHDFAWERGDRYKTPFAGVQAIIERCFPMSLPNVHHCVINRAARTSLVERCGIAESTVVPNVMDFEQPFGLEDDYNADMRQQLGVAKDDILLLQITRIVKRKGIETAIELVDRLANPKIKLVITGSARDDDGAVYIKDLEAQVNRLDLQKQVLFAGEHFDNQRATQQNGAKVYSLSDAYAHAAACTYFSTYEGFGNAFVEAVVARVPIFVNNYKPVYWPDIGSFGFRTVMIEDSQLTDEAVAEVKRVLDDASVAKAMTDKNFELGDEHFSYQALQRILTSAVEAACKR
jgi:glycosyltransferase involved in cell wall biosynthesis